LNESLADLPSEQFKMLKPIDGTIQHIEVENEWRLLEQTISEKWTSKTRDSSSATIT